jgi:adenosylmethionine-8-amino-7-oxononanoate aminotransferase
VIAKGLGGGYQPVGAVLVAGKIVQAIQRGSGFFQHGHTYLAHALSCAAALAVQRIIKRDGLVGRARIQGEKLMAALNERFGNHRAVGDIRGRGLFQAIELVKDRASKAPYDPAIKLNARVKQEAMARGLMVYPMGGTIDGRNGDHVLLAPPFTVTNEEIDAIVDRLGAAVDAAVNGATATA